MLAIGSNACPAQLSAKFRGRHCRDDLVGLVVTVQDLVVRPSAHLSRSGYWPFAPARLVGATTAAVLCLLDADQVAVLDATEPNYVRTRLDQQVHRVVGAGPLARVEVYVSRHGVVDDPRLPVWTDPPPTQDELLEVLLSAVPAAARFGTPAGLSAALRNDPSLATALSDDLRRALRTRTADLVVPPEDQPLPSENDGRPSNAR